jgi:hypothetical protein
VWTTSGKTSVEWFDGDAGQLAFWLDVCIATGFLERVTDGSCPGQMGQVVLHRRSARRRIA